jgi:hypothetical protein
MTFLTTVAATVIGTFIGLLLIIGVLYAAERWREWQKEHRIRRY